MADLNGADRPCILHHEHLDGDATQLVTRIREFDGWALRLCEPRGGWADPGVVDLRAVEAGLRRLPLRIDARFGGSCLMRLWGAVATTRISFEDLPAAALAAVESHTGPALKTETVSQGFNSEIAARVFTESGPLFVKGLRADHKRSWTQHREAAVNPYLRGIAPALLWKVEEAGWVLLGFENLSGHHADYSPGSPDLPKVAGLLARLGEVACPDIELRSAEQRFAAYAVVPADLEYFAGASLLHTDLNDHNVIVDDSAHLVDWAWATRGAAWLDAGYWVVWLIAAGNHTPESAEHRAGRIPAWNTAPAAGITAFARATENVWEEIAGDDPDEWTERMLRASRLWARFRQQRAQGLCDGVINVAGPGPPGERIR
ncbi:hypothetical protein OK074_7950 [Actinobacteria bacterium OK074]|nr:hypothetical protein OK074_7950 [Actinobacteria bacterium OK074]